VRKVGVEGGGKDGAGDFAFAAIGAVVLDSIKLKI